MPPEIPFDARKRGVHLPEAEAVVIADTHLGREEASTLELPLGAGRSVRDRLADLVAEFGPREVVIAGDVLHSFSSLPAGVESDLRDVEDRVAARGADLVLVAGNHDALLDSIADPFPEYRLSDGTVVCHGHDPPERDADRYVIGHEHPAIDIEGRRLPCHLWSEDVYEGADVLALPAFDALAAGTTINGRAGSDVQSPLLSELGRFRPLVYDEDEGDVLAFPPLEELREHLRGS